MADNNHKRWKWPLIILTALFAVCLAAVGALEYLIKESQEPATPKYDPGIWIELRPDGIISANGEPVYTQMRIGAENSVLVFFYGGGICYDDFTGTHPFTGAKFVADENGFYTADIDGMIPDYCELGLGSSSKNNPFKDWTVIIIPYTTGDFHLGTTDHLYSGPDGSECTVHHHGYINYRAIMDEAVRYIPDPPDELLVAGYSAGGFGAAALTGDLIENYFPQAGHVSVCIDSSLLFYDHFTDVAADIWEVPDEIAVRFVSDDPIYDLLSSLYDSYGDAITFMYIGSVRDGELARYQNYLYFGHYSVNNMLGKVFSRDLSKTIRKLKQKIPEMKFYLFDRLPFSIRPDQIFLTQHTITVSPMLYWPLTDGMIPVRWIHGCVADAAVRDHGLNLLGYWQ